MSSSPRPSVDKLTPTSALARGLAYSAISRVNGNGGHSAIETWPLLDDDERELMLARAACVELDLEAMGFEIVKRKERP